MDCFLNYIKQCKKIHKIRCIYVDSSIILKDSRRSGSYNFRMMSFGNSDENIFFIVSI